MAQGEQQRNIVIVGGGIIGCTTAYFLTRHPAFNPAKHSVTLIEATKIAGGASGKAGGLLALWAYPSCLVGLSYRLHAELAAEHDGARRWGYRQVSCGSLELKGRHLPDELPKTGEDVTSTDKSWTKLPKQDEKAVGKLRAAGLPKDFDWFDAECIRNYSELGDTSTTAQVHPYQFTTSMAELSEEKGAKIVYGTVTNIDYTSGEVKSVTYTDKESKESKTIDADDVVVTAGPWTSQIFPDVRIDALRAHSVVIKADVSPYAVFSEITLPYDFGRTDEATKKVTRRHGVHVSPEMYARPDGTVYACGEGDTLVPLPKTTDEVETDQDRCQDIIDYCASVSTTMGEGEILARQACYLPSVSGGRGPLIGETGTKGLLLAAGHSVWGIQNSCATGKLISEFVFEGKARSAKIAELDPRKYMESTSSFPILKKSRVDGTK